MTLTYVLRGGALALAWFLLVNVASCAVIARLAGAFTTSGRARTPAFWFGLRMFPSAMAAAFVAAVFVPSYLAYEPLEYGEGFDVSLAMLAIAAAAVMGTALLRGIAAWWRASRRVRAWMRRAECVAVPDATLPVYAIDADAPLMALAGIWRPRLIVARGLLGALTPEELAASVAHEAGHFRSRDNLKRLVMRAAPDVLSATAAARALEQKWASAAEHTADRVAGRDSTDVRCALASALVKVARLTPFPAVPGEPISTFVGGGEIVSRVEQLLDDRALVPSARGASARRWMTAIGAIGIAAAGYAPLLRAVHAATEILVHTLP
ncbi:MAG: M56 family metallopeptidase [Acidobacteria bacterium]|nr:M56 family metallopeptidase [Acidobacteriota bacterium]